MRQPEPETAKHEHAPAFEITAQGHGIEVQQIPGSKPGSPHLVFLHEGLGSVSHWKDFPARVAAATECAVTVYSRYGNGNSDRYSDSNGHSQANPKTNSYSEGYSSPETSPDSAAKALVLCNRYAFIIVEFKMARRQGATREHVLSDLRPRSNAGAGHFQPNPPDRGSLGEFPRRSLGQYRSGYRRFSRSLKFAQTPTAIVKPYRLHNT